MKRIFKIGQSLLVIVLLIALVYYDRIGSLLENLNSGEGGVLLSAFKFIGRFFVDADMWNIIILFITLSFVMILITLMSLGYEKLFRWLSTKYKVFQITQKSWFSSIRLFFVGATLFVLLIVASNTLVIVNSMRNTIKSVDEITEAKPVVLLGTSKMLRSGKGENLYYTYRIEAALELWNAGKAKRFIVSGDRTEETGYDETADMKADLIAGGVPEELIELDGDGDRTLDSMLRIRSLFKVDDLIIVSQKFHTQRALFLSRFYGISAMAFNAKGSATNAMLKREAFGKVKMLLDLYAFNMQPKESKHDDYREKFEVKSDGHVMLLLLVVVTVIMSFWLMVNLMEKNTKGIYKKLIFTFTGLVGAIIFTVSLYETTDILDGAAKVVAENTGIGIEAVERKEKRKEETVKLIEEIKEKQVEETVKFDSVYSNYVASIEVQKVDSSAVNILEEVDDKKVEEVKEQLLASLDFGEKNKDEENLDEEISDSDMAIKKALEETNDPFAGLSLGNDEGNDESLNTEGLDGIKNEERVSLKVAGTQLVENNSVLSLRVLENVVINGKRISKNSIIQGKVYVQGSLLNIDIVVNGDVIGKGYNNNGESGFALSLFDKSDDSYIVSDGFMMVGSY